MQRLLTLLALSIPVFPSIANAAPEAGARAPSDRISDASPTTATSTGPLRTITGVIAAGPASGSAPAAVELAVQTQYWLGEHVGVGGRVGYIYWGAGEWSSQEVDALTVEPSVFGRVGSRWTTGYVGTGIGPAYRDERSCVDYGTQWFGSCQRWSHDPSLSFTASATAGVAFHPWRTGFTFGPQGRVQSLGTRNAAATVGVVVGGSI